MSLWKRIFGGSKSEDAQTVVPVKSNRSDPPSPLIATTASQQSVAKDRLIRVFVSSTFRDMQEEREELVKQIFPQLRRLCESRGVTWGEVDLRWGVPDEAKAEGKVLPLCLAEIERCRPYFIGLLGERYGWVPEQIPADLIEAQPWLAKYREDSVTALEILHGVLLNPEMAGHAFFYFRDPGYAAKRQDFAESDPDRRKRLATLKDDIRKGGIPVAENFSTPKQLGEWVLRDLTAVIEKLYPESTIPDPLDRAAADHEAYAASRRRVYIGRSEYIQRLDAHAVGDGPPLVVLGESGGGKSALLANWAHRWCEQHPETPVIVHFIGAAPDSADWMAMLRRVLGEFQRQFDIRIEIPDGPDALRMTFANTLHMVAARGRAVLVLDALNQIEDRDGAPDLVWLPPVIPANVRLIVSTLAGRPLEELRKRAWPILTVEPLKPEERETLIVDYLSQFAKQLSAPRRRRIAEALQSANGLYLTTLLNELRLFGSHEQLDRRIGWYLQATGPLELYGKVIHRWEQDYEERGLESEGIVGKSLSRLWAARRGLSETELLESLGTKGSPLPRAVWSPLFLAAADSLVNRGGLLTFAHDFLREAVGEAYLPTVERQQEAHRTLAAYFDGQSPGPRRLDELPWQWQEAAEWQSLADLLTQPALLGALWEKNQFEVKAYWTQIETHSPLRIEQVYAATIKQPTRAPSHAWQLGCLLADTGKSEAALRVRAGLVAHYRAQGDRANLSATLGSQALILKARGDLDGAMALHKEQERLCRELGKKDGLSTTLGNQAVILSVRGDLDGAMALYKEQERLCRELGNKDGLQASLGGQANILYDRGDLDGAMVLHKEEERLCRELGNKDGLQGTLGNHALILKARGDLDGAMALHKEQERLCRELGNKDGLSTTLGNQAVILYTRGDLDGATALHKEQERLCRELGNKDGLSTTLGNEAVILYTRGDLDGAMALYKEQERLYRELGKKDGMQRTLGNQALILKARGDLDGAMALHKEEERLCRELGSKDGMQRTLGNQASILYTRGDLDGATALYKEQERLCRELGDKDGMQATFGNQASILQARGDLDSAMTLYKEQERLCRELGKKDGMQRTLGNQALILKARGDLDGAMALHKEEERLSRELGDKDGLSATLGNQASILYARGDFDGATALYKEQERLCRELGNKDGMQRTLGNQGWIFYTRGDLDGAMALYKEQERLCRELGNKDGMQRTLGNQALILKARGDLDGAMALHKEEERLCRELGNKDGMQRTLGNQALILKARGDLDGAMALHKEEERLCRELGNQDGLSATLGNQAVILYTRGDLDGAMALHKEEERLCRELGNKDGIQRTLGNQALILYTRGDLGGATALYKEQERLCRELGNKDGLSATFGNQAVILDARGDLDGAMALYKEQERLCRELGNKDGMQRTLGNQAVILYTRGDLDGAMALYKEQERLCRELGNKDGMQRTLGNQGLILQARGDLDGAMVLYKEQERLCRELGDPYGLSFSLASQALVLSETQGSRNEARQLADEALAIAAGRGYRQLMPQFQRIRDSIPADEE